MKIKFCGGVGMVTGSNHFLETKNQKILIDCGLFQGRGSDELNRQDFPYQAQEIDAVLVTHAHLDHVGRLPLLVKEGFSGKIYTTKPTRDLAKLILSDCEEIYTYHTPEGKDPLYNKEDVKKTMSLFEPIKYGKKNKHGDIEFCFRDAGHVLGSAFIEVWAEGKKIVFSGDLGNSPTPLLKDLEVVEEADYVLVESTYGDRVHEDKIVRKNVLEDTIEETIARGGVMLIPSFALERTQELIYELNELAENHRIPPVPVFIDSPLAIELTKVYQRHLEYFDKEASELIASGDDLFKFPGLKMTSTVEDSKKINHVKSPKIIIAGSGMSTGGRILFHEKMYLDDPKNTFLIICYQVKGTLGRKIFEKQKNINIFGQDVSIRAQVKAIGGYSAHADQEALFNWIHPMRSSLQKVFVVHGEEEPAQALAQKIKDHLGISTQVPSLNQEVEL